MPLADHHRVFYIVVQLAVQSIWAFISNKGSDGITVEVNDIAAKQSVTIKHMIEDNLANKGPILLTKVPGNILAKVLEHYKRVVTQPPAGGNDHEKSMFRLLVVADLDIKVLLSLDCEDILEQIVLQGSDNITFKVNGVVAKQSVTIKHMIKDSLASRGPILLPKVPSNILAKVIEYYKYVVTQLPPGLLSLACDDVLDMIKWKHPELICRFSTSCRFFPRRGGKYAKGESVDFPLSSFCLMTFFVCQ
ncbi:hypothetical protein M9H77_08191 [Catharanthus roseus]|uniref:Uncharacterized protein n=1 Tax=Catharanthus roseus TaxID=4058 RepID=A0ACC0BX74_CATRO|nr:hypothetical protein M9H77_08191 [Catharanthus roseus]